MKLVLMLMFLLFGSIKGLVLLLLRPHPLDNKWADADLMM